MSACTETIILDPEYDITESRLTVDAEQNYFNGGYGRINDELANFTGGSYNYINVDSLTIDAQLTTMAYDTSTSHNFYCDILDISQIRSNIGVVTTSFDSLPEGPSIEGIGIKQFPFSTTKKSTNIIVVTNGLSPFRYSICL